jgi:hypothetical protein
VISDRILLDIQASRKRLSTQLIVSNYNYCISI